MSSVEADAFEIVEDQILGAAVSSVAQAAGVLEVVQYSLEGGGRSDDTDFAALDRVRCWLAAFAGEARRDDDMTAGLAQAA